jgi:hypothetical protein
MFQWDDSFCRGTWCTWAACSKTPRASPAPGKQRQEGRPRLPLPLPQPRLPVNARPAARAAGTGHYSPFSASGRLPQPLRTGWGVIPADFRATQPWSSMSAAVAFSSPQSRSAGPRHQQLSVRRRHQRQREELRVQRRPASIAQRLRPVASLGCMQAGWRRRTTVQPYAGWSPDATCASLRRPAPLAGRQ